MATCEYDGEFYECSWQEKYVLPIYDTLDQSPLADFVKESMTIVPWAGTFHLLALALLGGAVFLVDLRLLGAGLSNQSPQALQKTVSPLARLALGAIVISGVILALGELMKLYYSPPYWLKMFSLFAAVLFTFGVRNRLIASEGRLSPLIQATGAIAIIIWLAAFAIFSNTLARIALLLLLAALSLIVWRWHKTADTTALMKGVAALSIVMWLTTAAAGRWIAFY
ncbi:MAG: hypothetical protein MRY59_02300 [Aquisalinus sp.]|nr:hypothetical protein [Aquisalinus sp.]